MRVLVVEDEAKLAGLLRRGLRSRGMGEATARSMLTYAFASEVVDRIGVPRVREQLDEELRSTLRQGW